MRFRLFLLKHSSQRRCLPMKEAAMATFSHIPSSLRPIPGIEPQGGSLDLPSALAMNECEMVGESAAMKRLRLQIRRIGPHFRTILITGENGAGKETIARALHRASASADGPFITAASGNRIDSLVKAARCGTLFFDQISEMPLETQDELIEVLRRHEWTQNGLAAPQKTSIRIIVSTDEDLRALAVSRWFRQELYQRIAMVQIAAPALRERMEDVPALAMHLVDRLAGRYRRKIAIAKDAMVLLQSHGWPGNVRELENVLEDAALRSEGGVIEAWQIVFPEPVSESSKGVVSRQSVARESVEETMRLQDVMDRHVLHVLKTCAGNKLRAAELLGISRSTLYRMLETCSSSQLMPGM